MSPKNDSDYQSVKRTVEGWVETANSDPAFLAGATSGVTDDEELDDVDVESVALTVKINYGWEVNNAMDCPRYESVRIGLVYGGPFVSLVVDKDGGVIEGKYASERYCAYVSDDVAERIYDYWKDYAEGVAPAFGG